MKNWKWVSILIVALSLLFMGNELTVQAEEVSKNEVKLEINLLEPDQTQEVTYVNNKNEEVTIKIDPVLDETISSNISILSSGHYLPYGTTKRYKISKTSIHMGMSYYVDIYIPSNVANSKFTRAYDANYWVLGGSLSDVKLTRTNKEVTYSANASWVGGLAGSNVWLKARLNNNVLSVYYRY